MRIREGKRYVTRDGQVTGAVTKTGHGQWRSFVGDGIARYWQAAGYYLNKFQNHPLDLVAEYREDGK